MTIPDIAGHDLQQDNVIIENPAGVDIPPIQMGVMQDPQGKPIVALQIVTMYGQQVFPMPAAFARRVGLQLQQAGSAAETGLIVAR